MQMDISLIVPAYNEAATIRLSLERCIEAIQASGVNCEIVVVDDGSTDDTATVATEVFKSNFKEVNHQVFRYERNRGKGYAIRQGLPLCTGEYVIIHDADLEYDPDDIFKLYRYAQERDLPALYGSRYLYSVEHRKGRFPTTFYLGGQLVTWVTNLLYGQHLTDEPTCYKLFKRSLLLDFDLECEGFEFCPEVTAKAALRGIKIEEVPISYFPRSIAEGKKISWRDGVVAIRTLLKYRFRRRSHEGR